MHRDFAEQCVADEDWSLLLKALRRRAATYCRATRNEYQARTDQYVYSADGVRALLEAIFQPCGWQRGLPDDIALGPDGAPLPRLESDPATTGSIVAEFADVSRGLDRLTAEQRRVLEARYGYPDAGWEAWAAACGLSEVAYRRAVSRALHRLTDLMNGALWQREHTGTRRLMTHSQATRITAMAA